MALAGFGYPEPEDTALPGDNSDVMIVNLNPIAEKLITVGACGENKKEGFRYLSSLVKLIWIVAATRK